LRFLIFSLTFPAGGEKWVYGRKRRKTKV